MKTIQLTHGKIEKMKSLTVIDIRPMLSHKGNPVPNQYLIETKQGTLLRSYRSNIALKKSNGQVVLGKDWDYSVTTGKYRNMFLGENKQETIKKIKNGIYTIDINL